MTHFHFPGRVRHADHAAHAFPKGSRVREVRR